MAERRRRKVSSPKGAAASSESHASSKLPLSPANGQSHEVRGCPPGWKAPSEVTSGFVGVLAGPVKLAAAFITVLLSPLLWLVSKVHDKIMMTFLNNEYIYNVSWEDPRIDQRVFNLTRDDHVITIASAGDNAFDYIIEGAKVTAVDFNLCQIALTELKVAACRTLPYEEFWRIFAENDIALLKERYPQLRPLMQESSQTFWDGYKDKISSFLYSGTSGWAAYYLFRFILPMFGFGFIRNCILKGASREEFEVELSKRKTWIRCLTWFLDNVCLEATSLLAGVPRMQLELGTHRKDNFAIIMENVLGTDLVNDNYFYLGYILGKYTKNCCPRYLEEQNYEALRKNLEDGRLELFHGSFEQRLAQCHGEQFTVASLLDHMDWMPAADVQKEIALLTRHMNHETGRIYWRSWSENVHSAPLMWLNPVRVDDYDDRVWMYFSTWIAHLKDTPFTVTERCHSWGKESTPSIASMVTTGLKIVTFPAWKHFTSVSGEGHQRQMELFYNCQKDAYDSFRESLLHARPMLVEYLPIKKNVKSVWVDIGGGTARNLEYLPVETIRERFEHIYIVDVSTSLLSIAKTRLEKYGLSDMVTLIEHDVTSSTVFDHLPAKGTVDVVTMSYSLSMIPDKERALENAFMLLKPRGEGFLGIADFWMQGEFENELEYPWSMLRKLEAEAHRQWFKQDGVHLLPNKLMEPYASNLVWSERKRGSVPFIPVLKPFHGVFVAATPLSL